MKINTDGVLLGALANADKPKTILDIGTGTGVIALMLAQRFAQVAIDAVEIDDQAAQTASANFANSPFFSQLTLYPVSFEQYFNDHPSKKYDLMVSNPPFYINSLQSPGAGKNLAKHTDVDFFARLITGVAAHLTNDGLFWLILPLDTAAIVKQLAAANGLYLQQIIAVKSYPASAPHREIVILGLHQIKINQSEFVIYDALKQYSEQYVAALRDFFTIFS